MILDWQTTENTNFPYLWCYGCNKPLPAGLSIQGESLRRWDVLEKFWMRLCPDCLDAINTFMRAQLVAEINTYDAALTELEVVKGSLR